MSMDYQQQPVNMNMNMNANTNMNNSAQNEPEYKFEQEPETLYSNNLNRKKRGLNLYQKPILEIFNPRTSCVTFFIDARTGDLGITMAPAIPNNPAIGLRGPVPKGAKVYDWSKRAVSYFAIVEVYDLIHLLQNKYKSVNNYGAWIVNSFNILNEIKNYMSTIQNNPQLANTLQYIDSRLTTITNHFNQVNSAVGNIDDHVGLYRRSASGDKAWNFTWDANTNMIHINCMIGRNKETAMRSSISNKMALKLLEVLESYAQNYAVIQIITNNTTELSKTLAKNNILAPTREENDMVI